MKDLKKIIEILFTLKDKATSPLKKTNKTVKNTGKQSVSASKSVDKLDKSLVDTSRSAKKAGKEIKKYGQETDRADKKTNGFAGTLAGLGKKLKGTAGAFVAFGAVIATTVLYPLKEFAVFQDKMAMVQAVSRATAAEFKALTAIAEDLGRKTRYSATEAADGLLYLTKAGIKAADAGRALPNVLQLAQAGAIDLAEAADISTNIMSAYGMTVKDLAGVNDVLARAFTTTNSTLAQIGQGFKFVGPIAKGLGANFNDLIASVGMLHNAGLKAEMSGTILRNSLDALFNPTRDEAKMMQILSRRIGGTGLQIKNSEGNFIGFASIIGQLEKAGFKADEALRMFGMRAGPGIAALLEQGSSNLSDFKTELDNSGGALNDISGIMEKTLTNSFKSAQSAVSGLAITIGKKLSPVANIALRGFATSINLVTDAAKLMSNETLKSVLALEHNLKTAGTMFTSKELEAGRKKFVESIDSKLIDNIKGISQAEQDYLNKLIPLYKQQSAEIDKVTKAKLIALSTKKETGQINEKQFAQQSIAIELAKYESKAAIANKYYANIKKYYQADTDEYRAAAKVQEKTADQLLSARMVATKKWAEYHNQQLNESLRKEKSLTEQIASIQKTKADLAVSTEDKLFAIKQRGRTESQKEAATQKKAYRELENARKAFYAGDEEAAKKSAERASDLFFTLDNNAKAYKGVQSAAQLTGKILDAESIKAEKALDLQRKSSEMLRTSLESVNKSVLQLTVSLQKAMGIDSSQAEASLQQLGNATENAAEKHEKSKESLQEIRDIVKAIPLDGFKIEADVRGITETKKLSTAIESLRDKTVTVTTRLVEQRVSASAPQGFSDGGKLPGFGGGDQHPALLESGEWVINKDAVKRYGSSFFNSLNSMSLPNNTMHLASGGPVAAETSQGSNMTVNLNLPGSEREIPAQMSEFDANELIGQLKRLDRLGS